tara:strand:- start:169 stop:1140 length:972 start_codon:yes stop_codon:yes gene_type:complete
MKKYLIFRTDGIGDFLISYILITAIKRNDPKSSIIVIASKKNYSYVKSFSYIDEIVLFPDNYISRFKLLYSLRKKYYDEILVLDGKERSIITSLFLSSKNKILLNCKKYHKKIFKFFYKFIFVENINSHFRNILSLLKIFNFDFKEEDLNCLNNRNYEKSKISKYEDITKEKISILHLDEKWIFNEYISFYLNIEPKEEELAGFVEEISIKIKNKLIITTGIKSNRLIESLRSRFINNDKVIIISKLDFLDLEYLISKSNLLISCHGAASHIANSKNIKIIDIIDHNPKNPYEKWTEHFRNYNPIYRKKFSELSKEIINNINS